MSESISQDQHSVTGGPVASRLGQFSWGLFDWANQPYFTLITTFIFAPYFASGFIGDPDQGQALWALTIMIAGITMAVGAPILGAIADQVGARKPWIMVLSLAFAASSSVLWFAYPGAPDGIVHIVLAVAAASFFMEYAVLFNNAMLPSIVSERRMGRLSGFGWGIGYVGGLLSLFLVLFLLVSTPETGKTLIGLDPLWGLDPDQYEADRLVGPLAALWFLIFILPLLLFTPDQPSTGVSPGEAVRRGFRQLAVTLAKLGAYKNILLFLIARMSYFDGLSAIFAFGGVYAAGVFGWEIQTLAIFGIILSIFAAVGAFVGGYVNDALGSKPTILIAVFGLITANVLAVSITADTIFFVIPVEPNTTGALFGSVSEQVYLVTGILIGVFGGPAQAASRTLMARLSPKEMMTEFFGLYSLSGKATSFVAPFAVYQMTTDYSQRAGLSIIIVFLVVGFFLLLGVKEPRRSS